MNNEFFNKALSNFINDFASGGAIRHLADKGYSVSEISEMLDFPTPKEKVAQIVWKHYLDTGKIRLTAPDETGKIQKVSYVKEQGKYGSVSMRRVVEEVVIPQKEYVVCDLGKMLYKKNPEFLSKINTLPERERSYVMDLPWPLTPVYYEADDMIKKIINELFIGQGGKMNADNL